MTSLIAAMNNSPQTDAMVRMSKLMKDFLGVLYDEIPLLTVQRCHQTENQSLRAGLEMF